MWNALTLEENKMLSVLVVAATWAVETHSLQKTGCKMALQNFTPEILDLAPRVPISNLWEGEGHLFKWEHEIKDVEYTTELETLWNFVHVRVLKLRMPTSEIHLNSLHVSQVRIYNFTDLAMFIWSVSYSNCCCLYLIPVEFSFNS